MLAAFIFRRLNGSSFGRRPDVDAPENEHIKKMLEFSAQQTLDTAAKFAVGDVIEAESASCVRRVGKEGALTGGQDVSKIRSKRAKKRRKGRAKA